MIKALVRKYLLEHAIIEAEPTAHFNDRMTDVVDNIVAIKLPPNAYLPNIPKELQDKWIISQIQQKINAKVQAIIDKDYPIGRGICSVAPLGMLKLQPTIGNQINILVTVKRSEGLLSGYYYYVTIYDNRLPSIVLSDVNNSQTNTPGAQLQAHINNNIKRGDAVDKAKSFIDKSFMDSIIVDMRKYPTNQSS